MRWIRSGESTRGLTEEENGGCLEELAGTEREHSVCGVSVWVLFGELRKRVAGARICGGVSVVQCNEVPPGALVTGNPTRYLVCTWYGTCTGIVPVSQVSRYQVGLNNCSKSKVARSNVSQTQVMPIKSTKEDGDTCNKDDNNKLKNWET